MTSILNDDLVAKSSPRGESWGNVVWTSMYAKYLGNLVPVLEPAPDSIRKPAMAYKMEHWTSTRKHYRTIDTIIVTNLYCGVGKGWNVIVLGSIMSQHKRKSDAQTEAEKLLDGRQ
jgi:hypothetical protein